MQKTVRRINPAILFAGIFGMLALIISVSVYSSTVSRNTIQTQAADGAVRTVSQVRDKLDAQLARIDSLLKQVHFDPQLRDLIQQYPTPPQNEVLRLQLYEKIGKILGTYSSTMKYIDGIHIFSDHALKNTDVDFIQVKNFGPESRLSITLDETNRRFLEKMVEDERNVVWVPTSKNGVLRSASLTTVKDYAGPTFSIGRKYANIKRTDGQNFFIVINMNAKFLSELFSNVDLGANSSVFVIDQLQKLVYDRDPEKFGASMPLAAEQLPAEEIGTTMINNEEQLIVREQSKLSGWQVVGTLPTGQLFAEVSRSGTLMYAVLGLLVIVMALTYFLINRFIAVQDRLQDQSMQLQKKNEELQYMDKMKDQFLANTSHELRTPINGIIGITESLVDELTDASETVRKDLRMIVNSGRRLSNLVNDILDFSKLRSNKLEMHLGVVSLPDALDVTLSLLRPMLAKKNLEIINEIEQMPAADRAKLRLIADDNRLQQILHNLLSNAIKFTEYGKIEIRAFPVGTMVSIQITDTGIGIPADKIDTIFNSFEQVDGSTARKYGGTGLGLSVTKQLVDLHHGSIKAESQLGAWTRMTVNLPMADPMSSNDEIMMTHSRAMVELDEVHDPAAGKTQEADNAITPAGAAKSQGKILVVDDEPINLQVILNHLKKMDFEVTTADNGLDAKEMIRNGYRPDLILLDVMMPRLSGFELVKLLRREFPQEELPILLLTAKNTPTDVVTGFESGANDYLVKPFTKMELIARIDLHMSMAKKHRQLVAMSQNVVKLLEQHKIDVTAISSGFDGKNQKSDS